ncbi:hypothetical protein MSG28_010877 [Choristoneura fumiferana]|uniref:Uncharacterized protein n=1 Tax=Choristoneura fumiferana TaxID=7141 RepID=A0ACC0KP43_CHOFU|nr:hypothetical protein MSG28_010877 [Choristoneura fumiferana]
MSDVNVLYEGYSIMTDKDQMIANCSCILITGNQNVIVDTMTAWDSEKIITALQKYNLTPDKIHYVVSTHGHSDHIGNNNLFLNAKHIVGYSVSFRDKYYMHSFDKGDLFEKYEDIEDPNVWLEAGSDDPVQQMRNRLKIAEAADWIVPGHGPKFQVTEQIRNSLHRQAGNAPV